MERIICHLRLDDGKPQGLVPLCITPEIVRVLDRARFRSTEHCTRDGKVLPEQYRVDAGNRTGRQDTSISDARFGPLELRIRPMGFPAMPIPNPASQVNMITKITNS